MGYPKTYVFGEENDWHASVDNIRSPLNEPISYSIRFGLKIKKVMNSTL